MKLKQVGIVWKSFYAFSTKNLEVEPPKLQTLLTHFEEGLKQTTNLTPDAKPKGPIYLKSFILDKSTSNQGKADVEKEMKKATFLEKGFSVKKTTAFEDIFKTCRYNLQFSHKNTFLLSQFMSPVGAILPKRLTGLSAKSQRQIGKSIKRAKHMGLLPYLYRPVFGSSQMDHPHD